MHPPVTSPVLALLGVGLLFIFVMLEINVIQVAYHKLGISHRAISSLLLITLGGSFVNIPIAKIPTHQMVDDRFVTAFGIPHFIPPAEYAHSTVIAINLGGAVIPILLSIYLIVKFGFVVRAAIATLIVSLVVYHFSELVPGLGIAVPTLLPGVLAALVAYLLDREHAPALAFVAGSLGCLLGADLLNLGSLSNLGVPIASIGGAGTFDGIFVSGVIAVLIA